MEEHHRKKKLPNIILHPFLWTNTSQSILYNVKNTPVIGLYRVRANRHHLYPKSRIDFNGINKEKYLLRLWEYKHFRGWNPLFQFCYEENGTVVCSELVIDEIITLMIIKHPYITRQVGSKAWKILFGDKNLDQALDLLCRMLAIKFNRKWEKVYPNKIELVVLKDAA